MTDPRREFDAIVLAGVQGYAEGLRQENNPYGPTSRLDVPEDKIPRERTRVNSARAWGAGWKIGLDNDNSVRPKSQQRHPLPDILKTQEHDEAINWITKNAMAIRRDNGDMDYSLALMVAAFEAGRDSDSAPKRQRAREVAERINQLTDERNFPAFLFDCAQELESLARELGGDEPEE